MNRGSKGRRGWILALLSVVAGLIATSWTWRGDDADEDFRREITAHAQMVVVRSAAAEIAGRPDPPTEMLRLMAAMERSPADRVYRAILEAELGSSEEAIRLLGTVPEDVSDVAILVRLYRGGELTGGEREGLIERWGWFGRLAGIHGLEKSDPRRAAIWDSARSRARRMMVVFTLAIPACLAGLVLFVMLLVRLKRGQVKARYESRDEGSGDLPWLQVVVLGLGAVLLLNIGVVRYARLPRIVSMWLPLLAVLWPLARGMKIREWAAGFGLARGDGVAREVLAGLVGYVTGLPLMVLGILMTALLARLTGWNPTHPMQREAMGGGQTPAWAIVVSACIWAPVVEEMLIRGAFYRYLRPRYAVVASASISALLFAIVHPQGIVGVPAIWALGVVFAGLREWRGSILAPMTAHALHNGTLVTMLLTILA